MPLGPLVALFSDRHSPWGCVPVGRLVHAAAEAGHQTLALVDFKNLESAPGFLEACRQHRVHPILGMTLPVSLERGDRGAPLLDVFDLHPLEPGEIARSRDEWVCLLAENRQGFKTLLDFRNELQRNPGKGVPMDRLSAETEGLHLILGPPGSILERVVAGKRPWRTALSVEPLLSLFPRSKTSFGGLEAGSDERALAAQIARLERLPRKIPSLAVHWVAYRDNRDRFWGLARESIARTAPPHTPTNQRVLGPPHPFRIAFQGFSAALSRVEKMAKADSDPEKAFRSTPPVYPAPRGTDVDSLFWTLGQEAAIATGHMRRPEVKERLYEEFQYYKQTAWPTVFLLLWDLRRRIGLPPGTLRPADDWIATSLFAHILGLSRVDPIRSGLSFQPKPLEFSTDHAAAVEIDCPQGWEADLHRAAEDLLGFSKAVILHARPLREDFTEWIQAARDLLPQWEELGFPGNRPPQPPPPPFRVDEHEDVWPNPSILHLSGRSIFFGRSDEQEGSRFVVCDPMDAPLLGGLNLTLNTRSLLTLASAACCRGSELPTTSDPGQDDRETLSDWIERHEGKVFRSPAYSDDSGPFALLGLSSSLVRLLTLPESTGYRPLLWRWMEGVPPKNLSELSNYLALAHHWSFWAHRPELRLRAHQSPFRPRPDSSPPWWIAWESFLRDSGIEARIAGRLGIQLERETSSTNGWLLYQDQLVEAFRAALGWPDEKTSRFLSVEDSEIDPESSDFAPLTGRVRREFLDFFGHPNPLPDRAATLRKAAEILGALESLVNDPCAWLALSSALFEEEIEERRSLYRLLPLFGGRVKSPRFPSARPHAITPTPGELMLGLIDVHGVGPRYASRLTWKDEDDSVDPLKSLFKQSTRLPDFSGPALLRWLGHRDRSLPLHVLETVIGIGVFDDCDPDRERLQAWVRDRALSRAKRTESVQPTLFDLGTAPGADEASSITEELHPLLPIEWETVGLRVPLSGSPLENLRGRIPEWWIDPPSRENRVPGLLVGWVQDIEEFGNPFPQPGGARDGDSDASAFEFSFLFQQGGEVYRIHDPEGLTAPLLPEEQLRESRLDGRRMHLREPLRLVLGVSPRPSSGEGLPPVYRLYAVEAVENLIGLGRDGSPSPTEEWAVIRAAATGLNADLVDEINRLADWFSAPPGTHSTALEIDTRFHPIRALSFFRRKSSLPPPRSVIASRILVNLLRQNPDVQEVLEVPRQAPLFQGDSPRRESR